MKGLLLKDYYLFLKRGCSMFILLLISLAVPFLTAEYSIYGFYPIFIISTMPMTLISYDIKDKWDKYACAMPYSKKEIVLEKYLFGIILSGVAIALTLISQCVASGVRNDFNMGRIIEMGATLLALCLFSPSFTLPFFFKFGAEKGRIAYLVVIGFLCATVVGFSSFGEGVNANVNLSGYSYIILAVAVLAYIGSILLSIKFLENKNTLGE